MFFVLFKYNFIYEKKYGVGIMAKVKLKPKTTSFLGVELGTYDGEKWFIRDIKDRKKIGIFGTYTLQEWESILKTLKIKQRG